MNKKRNKTNEIQTSTTPALQETNPPIFPVQLPEKVSDRSEGLAKVEQTFATKDPDLSVVLALQAAASLGDPRGNDRLIHKGTSAAVHSLGARDGLEALLAVQMVGAHNLAMRFLANAAVKEQTPAGIELFTNCANRLLRTFTAQVETLKTYRSKGEQKVAVEHVHIHRGGQAIVGAVNHSSTRGRNDKKD